MTRSWFSGTWLASAREIRVGYRALPFRVITALLVLAVAAAVVIPFLLRSHNQPSKVGVVASSPARSEAIVRTAARIAGVPVTVVTVADVATAEQQVRAGTLAAALVGGREVIVKQAPSDGTSSSQATLAEALAQTAGLSHLFAQLPPGAADAALTHGVALPIRGLTPPGRSLKSRITGLFAAILIYVVLVSYGGRITVGVGEEKASRVVEVLLATLRPSQLLAGKVTGLGVLALGQVAAVLATFVVATAATGSSPLHWASASVVVSGALWIVLGYAFYAAAFAAAGSMIERQTDASLAALPLQIPLILTYALSFTVLYGNANTFYWVLAFLPPTAPVAMPVLVAIGAAHVWQVALSALLCALGAVGMAWAAAAIYQRAILRTGGRVKLRQLLRA